VTIFARGAPRASCECLNRKGNRARGSGFGWPIAGNLKRSRVSPAANPAPTHRVATRWMDAGNRYAPALGDPAAGALTRREALVAGTATVLGLAGTPARRATEQLPVAAIQSTVGAPGALAGDVLIMRIARGDLAPVYGVGGVELDATFGLSGVFAFQPLAPGRALLNGGAPVLATETNSFIDGLRDSGLTIQGLYQQFTGLVPQVWFVHARGIGDPLTLARAVRNGLAATQTQLPQSAAPSSAGALDDGRLATILRGAARDAGGGCVAITIPRRDPIELAGVRLAPPAGAQSEVLVKAMPDGSAWVAPAFALTGREAMPVVAYMRYHDWFVGSLASRETEQRPQLYFAHMLQRGDPYLLAAQVRSALDLTAAR
jgi:hypothetical protein